ncbi:RagB/SusD family nutrient uptake outer membrane protein [Sinomicrobium weinanense]|uniref:RagB/SusD family nutrient uptake outer membrane protein n=1 Tax=Sinomicrobium weinanense TaxID=2842200 RepID=A0A926JRL3_9FLAO|nr:RagB/SusD family nutrient uptake outer membrane protein [Sinomicrobium weinanense]MBC9796153.1 RagB/SusD family nutrient uptake outer membrane protein [Sinomicrobium weinanense]MBU3121904.1 RagB/SusD family nutrient uptake outer membrane protein [Sinomicrobium weinanense]
MNNLRIKHIWMYVLVAVFATASCSDDFVDTKPLNEVPNAEVWADAALSEAFVLEIYNGFGQGGFDEEMLASASDEALFTHSGRGYKEFNGANSNPADQGWISGNYEWGNMYRRIRATNVALKNLEEPMFDNPELAERIRGEAYFLRAFFYQQLLRYYGAVPLVDKVYELNEEDYTIPRNTYEECVDFIVADCDRAAEFLKGLQASEGRATDIAAMALKARVLLYAASDLHDIPTASANSSVIAGYSNPEYLGYTGGNRTERWEKAKAAAKAVMDMNPGYKLDLSEPVSPEEGKNNYMALSLGGGSAMAEAAAEIELILGRFFVGEKQENGGRIGLYNGPNGYHNWSGNTPTQNLVDDYEMINGTRFDWNNPAHAAAPYTNRDPRFYASILYDGADWQPRTDDVAESDSLNQIQAGQYEIINDSGEKEVYYGLDTRNSSIEDWNGSYTGYTMRKFVDPDPAVVHQNTWQQIPAPILRYTEAVLNYVEACIELGEDGEAKTWLNKIRYRVGMPEVTESGDALRERYRNERRIELVYEEHRFHDVRRWMIAPETVGQQVRIMSVFGTLKPGAEVRKYHYDPDSYDYEYTTRPLDTGIEDRNWQDKMYFIAIHRDEINRNDQLVQNPGY